jgi:response regulator RpfG family c-di-GMP phosphodiesterase/DNA-binding CsgD family transcriptional regulator
VRIVVVARDADLATLLGMDPGGWLTARRDRAYDPSVVDAFARIGRSVLEELERTDEWERVLVSEPEPETVVDSEGLDALLEAFADFGDLKSPWMRGHSRDVATLAEEAGRHAGLDDAACSDLRRAGLLHDVGRVAVENGIWDKPGPLTAAEWERVRLHPYWTERVLARCTALGSLAGAASSHHERIDGSGYHRSVGADALTTQDRLLAAADVYAALTADRPHRPAYDAAGAARVLEAEPGLDPDAVACVLAAAGLRGAPGAAPWPAGLTDREVQVLRLIARGKTNREVAKVLVVSPKTVGRHVENIYEKIDVSSRAAAALFAMEHNVLD